MDITAFLRKVDQYIINPLIILGFTVAFLVFIWGLVEFIMHPDDDTGRDKGKRNIFYGIVGMLIMIGVFGIISIILDTFGLPNNTGFLLF
jgi:hypothetical protein